MPSYDPSVFNVTPYYDDFDEDKKFLRMLFRPGYAVQSRELTQLQTVLQNQIERFGNHIFKDGSRIIGGEITTQTLNFVRVQPTTANSPIFTISDADIVGFNLIQRAGDGTVAFKAKVVDYIGGYGDADPYGVAIISYLSGDEFTAGATLECDNPNKNMHLTVSSSTTVPVDGKCRVVATNEGVHYINGFFVKTSNQFEAAYHITDDVREFTLPTGVMGFDVQSVVVTEKDDFTIKDPANGSYNYNAPGAHRYKIDLVLTFLTSTSGADFIELVTYDAGVVQKRFDQSQYSDILKLFAQRTYDESGNYTVKPFDVTFRDNTATSVFADVGAGKAYMLGYEYESRFKETVTISKARTTGQYNDYTVDNRFDNYIIGQYAPLAEGTRLNDLFVLDSDTQSKAFIVYGATGPVASYTNGTMFYGLLTRIEPGNDSYSTQSGTMPIKAYISDIKYVEPTGALDSDVKLFVFNRTTNTSSLLLTDLRLFSAANPTSTSRLPVFSDIKSLSLIYPLNGNTPTTAVKEVDALSFIYEASRGFVVSATNLQPTVSLAHGVDSNWCFANGFVPTGTDILLDEEDGYYVVYESGSALTRGTLIKIVSAVASPGVGITKITAKITGDGDQIKFTSNLPIGSYYLIGKVKRSSTEISSVANPAGKIRIKTSAEGSETLTNQTITINSFGSSWKRRIDTNTAGDVYSMVFALDKADVYRINSVTNAAGVDISSHFTFDDGQRDSAYGLSALVVKPAYFALYGLNVTFSLTVTYSYYVHTGIGPFVVDSYVGVSYDNIPLYVSPFLGTSIHLANAVDFRYVAEISGYISATGTVTSTTPTITQTFPIYKYKGGFIPLSHSVVNTHEAYLPRFDKIVLSKNLSADGDDTTLHVLEGVPSDSPVIPEDLGDSMTLFVLNVPAYTFNGNDIKADVINNSRFTMKDVGDISQRVNNLEQYAILSDLENRINYRNLLTATGETAIKKAILVDTFDGHSVADVADVDHRCSVDVEHGEMKPSFNSYAYKFSFDGSDSGVTLTSDNILCAIYSKFDTPVVAQTKASSTIKVNPFGLPNWVGNLRITPHADCWYDTTTKPTVKSNDTGMNDAWVVGAINNNNGFGTQWNDWESIWTGVSVESTATEFKNGTKFFSKPREKTQTSLMSKTYLSKENIGREIDITGSLKEKYTAEFRRNGSHIEVGNNTLLNKSITPFVRSKTITFNAYNMKPKTQVHVFFDNVNVTLYCTQSGVQGPFTTNATDGSLTNITLSLPNGLVETGEKILRVIDDSTNDVASATTIAESAYYSSGIRSEDLTPVSSIRAAELRKQTPNSNKVVSNPMFRQKSLNISQFTQWIDPLAQTFDVSETAYPNGYYLESIDLYIASKDADLPITVEICPTVNSIPHPTVIIPFSTVVKSSSGITANASTPTATNFKFSTPVYLNPGTYALVVRANSMKYSLFTANIGEKDIITDDLITSTFEGGLLYKPQNGSEAGGDANTDLMFKANRCLFVATNSTVTLNRVDEGDEMVANIIQPNLFAFTPPGVGLTTRVQLASTVTTVVNSRNLPIATPYTVNDSATFDMIMVPTNTDVGMTTFMVDLDRTNVVVVENLINSSDSTTSELSPTSGKTDSTARYITRKVSLGNGSSAEELIVFIDANIPKDSFIRVYAKTGNNQQSDSDQLNNLGYESMDELQPTGFFANDIHTYSVTPQDYREGIYRLISSAGDGFDAFIVKICLYSTNTSAVPTIKNLRIVALS